MTRRASAAGRWGLLFAIGAACGRLGFDEPRSTAGDDGGVSVDGLVDGAIDDAAVVDAVVPNACAGGDTVCRVSCLGTDPDCSTTCGDGTCVGNAGELCTTCAECNTTADVCGNGDCSPTEDSDTCFADCGPTPWTWATLDTALLAEVNARRAAGISCGGAPIVAGPLTMVAGLQAGARERAWELAHAELTGAAPSCNGRTVTNLGLENGASSGFALMLYAGSSSPQAIVDFWIATPALCSFLVDPQYASAGTAIAMDSVIGAALFVD